LSAVDFLIGIFDFPGCAIQNTRSLGAIEKDHILKTLVCEKPSGGAKAAKKHDKNQHFPNGFGCRQNELEAPKRSNIDLIVAFSPASVGVKHINYSSSSGNSNIDAINRNHQILMVGLNF
jgi:hypothetical protein